MYSPGSGLPSRSSVHHQFMLLSCLDSYLIQCVCSLETDRNSKGFPKETSGRGTSHVYFFNVSLLKTQKVLLSSSVTFAAVEESRLDVFLVNIWLFDLHSLMQCFWRQLRCFVKFHSQPNNNSSVTNGDLHFTILKWVVPHITCGAL